MTFYEPLDLQFWLVQVFSGTPVIFSIVSMLTLLLVCLNFKIPTSATLVLMVTLSGLLLTLGQTWWLRMIIFVMGGILFWLTRKITE